jgi:hypothetical protein
VQGDQALKRNILTKEAFDQMYGIKANTKHACILDSGGKKTANPQQINKQQKQIWVKKKRKNLISHARKKVKVKKESQPT